VLDGQVAVDLNDQDEFDADELADIQLSGGLAAVDYNFGELAVTTSKLDFVGRARYRT
jgi:hypothetical protein